MNINSKILVSSVSVALLIQLAGCGGEFSYKRGAGPADFQNEKASCHSKNSSDEDIDACLAKSGWVVVSPDKPLFIEASVTDNRPLSAPTAKDKPEVPAEPVKLNPLDKVEVGSWWKTGASPEQLLKDGQMCASELGEPHKAEKNMSLVTIGIVKCMKDKGWYALKK